MLSLRKLFLFSSIILSGLAHAQVKYDEGALYVDGLTFLQSSQEPKDYYYLPQFPRLSVQDGVFEFLCLKFTSDKPENSGGLLHALVEFSLPDSILKMYEKELKKIIPDGRIAGPVPLLESVKKEDEEDVRTGFQIVSGVLSNVGGKESMTRSVMTSGYAPFNPGSKAAIAAILNPAGATLLWNSFTGPTSDVSIAVNGYYEAVVRSYNAIVTAEMSVIYTHLSKLSVVQEGYDKEDIRKIVDDLQKKGSIKIEVFDRSAGLGIKASDMEGILSVITNKLTETMFDTKAGWSTEPERIDPNLGFDPRRRQGDKTTGIGQTLSEVIGAAGEVATDIMGALPVVGWFSSKKKKDLNPKYVTDNQFVLKDIKNVRMSTFYLNLSKSTTIKVPFHTAGNLGGLYAKLGEDPRYFRIVNMNDPAYERRTINFQVDGDFVDAFDDIINFVTVNLRKKYSNGQPDLTADIMLDANDLKKGKNLKEISFPRLGLKNADWTNYEYQMVWSFKGRSEAVRYPADANQWIKSSNPAISLIPPLVKEYVEIDADRQQLIKEGVASAHIKFASSQAGEKKVIRTVMIRAEDKTSTNKIALYHDINAPVVYQPTWHKSSGDAVMDMKVLTAGYLFLTPPAPDKFIK